MLKRRTFCASSLGALGGLGTLGTAAAQDWPTKPVRMVTAFGPGSASDIVARMIAEDLQATFKQTFIVDNKPGASGILAADNVAKSAPDGYTLFLTTNTPNSVNPHLFKKLPYDPIRDFTPIARVCYFPFVLAVSGTSTVRTFSEFLAQARSGAKHSYAFGNSTGQVAGAAFTTLAKLDATAVPYKSTPQALTDLIGKQVDFMFVDLASSRPHMNSGRVRALAVTTEQRSVMLPELPTVAEGAKLPGFDLAAWVGVIGPAGMPPAIVGRLSAQINTMLNRKDTADKLAAMGAEVAAAPAAELDAYMRRQFDVWGRKVKDAGIEPE